MVRLPLQASSKPLLCGGLHQSLLPLWERHWWMAKKTPGEWVADMHGSILYSSILICSRQEEISEGKGYVWFVCCLIYRIECYWRQYDVVFICSLSFAKVFDTLSLTIMILKLHQTLIGLLLGTLSLTTMILKLSQTPIGLLLGIWSLTIMIPRPLLGICLSCHGQVLASLSVHYKLTAPCLVRSTLWSSCRPWYRVAWVLALIRSPGRNSLP